MAAVRVPRFHDAWPGYDQRHTHARFVQVPFAERPLRTVVGTKEKERIGGQVCAGRVQDRSQVVVRFGDRRGVTGAPLPGGRRVDTARRERQLIRIVTKILFGPRDVRPVTADEQAQRFGAAPRRFFRNSTAAGIPAWS